MSKKGHLQALQVLPCRGSILPISHLNVKAKPHGKKKKVVVHKVEEKQSLEMLLSLFLAL